MSKSKRLPLNLQRFAEEDKTKNEEVPEWAKQLTEAVNKLTQGKSEGQSQGQAGNGGTEKPTEVSQKKVEIPVPPKPQEEKKEEEKPPAPSFGRKLLDLLR